MREKKPRLLLFCSLFIRMIISVSLQTNNQFISIELIYFFGKIIINYISLEMQPLDPLRFQKKFYFEMLRCIAKKYNTHFSIIIEFSSFLIVRLVYQSICHIAFEPNQK